MPAVEGTPLIPTREAVARTPGVIKASWYIEDATRGLPLRVHRLILPSSDLCWTREAYLLADNAGILFLKPVLVVLFLLCFMEMPLWCGPKSLPKWTMDDAACQAADPTSQIYLSDIPSLPPMAGVLIELVCYGVLIALLALDLRWRGWRRVLLEKNVFSAEELQNSPELQNRLGLMALALIAIVDTLVYACVWQSNFRLAPYMRLATIMVTEPLRTTFKSTAEAVPGYLRILVILVFT